jgi:hypothetical protein
MSLINTLKYHGRGVVLPVNEIKDITRRVFTNHNISHVVDFGSGTLFWSEYFADEPDGPNINVTAVDTCYVMNPPPPHSSRISTHTDIVEVLASPLPEGKNAIFMCDVIHHLPPEFWGIILPRILTLFDVVVIKDIDQNRKFGNFCNRMHDRVINGEKIHDVDPVQTENALKQAGFSTKSKALPKLWYPHFVVVGVRT